MGSASTAQYDTVGVHLPASVDNLQVFERRLAALSHDLFNRALFLTRNRDTASDLVQDAIVKALCRRHSFHEANLRGWAMSILYNAFVDSRRRRRWLSENFAEASAAVVEDRMGPLEVLSLQDVETAMGVLTVENRRLFRMAYLEKRPHREISAATGLCIKTLATRLFRARLRLRKELTRTYESRLLSATIGDATGRS